MRRLSVPEALLVVEPQPLTLAPVKGSEGLYPVPIAEAHSNSHH